MEKKKNGYYQVTEYAVYGHKHPMSKENYVYIGSGTLDRPYSIKRHNIDHIIWMEEMLVHHRLHELVTIFDVVKTKKEAHAIEKELIARYTPEFNKSNNPEYQRPKEIGEKISKALKGRQYDGRPVPLEVRKKMSESHKGNSISQETRDKISESLTGKVVSLETRQKMSVSQKKRREGESNG